MGGGNGRNGGRGDRMGAASIAGDESCHERWGSLNMNNNKAFLTLNRGLVLQVNRLGNLKIIL